MGRRRTRLIAAAGVALLAVSFTYGVAVGRYRIFPFEAFQALRESLFEDDDAAGQPPGRWHRARNASEGGSSEDDGLESLSGLGYLGGYTPVRKATGATVFDADAVHDGLTLFCSGHAPEVYLISLTGEVVHKWKVAFEDLWPAELPFESPDEHRHFVRRAHLFPNGDLLGIFEYIGIFKLDRDSNVLWKQLNQSHHDFTVAADGSIVSLVRRHRTSEDLAASCPGFEAPETGVFDDQIAFLDEVGRELRTVSLFEAFYRSEYAPSLNPRADWNDMFHANSVDVIEEDRGRAPLAAGEVLVSLRASSAVISVDPEERRVSWMFSGKTNGQHQAQLLDSGNVLLLDNCGGNRQAPLRRDRSEVLEIDPRTQDVVWRYGGNEKSPFFTHWLGYVQRLGNGNTLVTESTQGRIFEVTPEGRIVWEYLSPHRAGDEGEFVATVMGARRISPGGLPFLDR